MSPRKRGLRLHICSAWLLLTTYCFSYKSDADAGNAQQKMKKPSLSLAKLRVQPNALILSTHTPFPVQENQPPYCSNPLAPERPSPTFPGQSPPEMPPVLPPNAPYYVPSPPKSVPEHPVWCVAKPTVPPEAIQAALNYACGSGADCEPIKRNGLCFQPDTLLAHAAYAFNSYWQKTKLAGATCDFGATAMLVTVDPSYDKCHFVYA